MENVMGQLVSGCKNFAFWHKLSADDLVLCIGHTYLEEQLKTLHQVSDKYGLQIKPKKWAIFSVRGHNKINDNMNLIGIPVSTEYGYLGVMID